jgi:hypothetical protein
LEERCEAEESSLRRQDCGEEEEEEGEEEAEGEEGS